MSQTVHIHGSTHPRRQPLDPYPDLGPRPAPAHRIAAGEGEHRVVTMIGDAQVTTKGVSQCVL